MTAGEARRNLDGSSRSKRDIDMAVVDEMPR
jgi:hypothetical protein